MKPASPIAYRLFHQGALALSRMESVGLPIDSTKLAKSLADVTAMIRTAESSLRKSDIYKAQQRKFGKDTNLNSRDQLAWVLYTHMKMPGGTKSDKGRYKLDEDTLRVIDDPFIDDYLKWQKLNKLKGTYLGPMSRECIDGRVYGFLNLHNVKTYRLSADSPNLNNLPSRNGPIVKLIKSTICPPEGQYIVEIDYSALEVFVALCYHRDPTMFDNLITSFDMHTSLAKQCFLYDDLWIADNPKLAKILRTETKGSATFGFFYGNYYLDVALRLWKTAVKTGMVEHLAGKGIKRLGLTFDYAENKWVEHGGPDAFVTHIQSVEHDFWGKRYPQYGQWRRDWYQAYLQKGYFNTLTGFVWHGAEKRNFVINCPIQGSAAHCLLQSIIDIQAEIAKRKMRSQPFLEVHDSLLATVPREELHEYVAMASDIMTTKLREKWPWLIIPLKVEVEVSDVSWFDKKSYTGDEK